MATGGDTVLELDRLSVAYYRAPVVRDLTLTVGRGEVVALLGANGAGKTTTLRAISGLLKPAGGAVRLCGQDLAGVSATARARLGLAHVPHDRGIFFGLTVAEHFRLDGLSARPSWMPRSTTSRRCASCAGVRLACCPAASSRCWRSRGPSAAGRSCSCSTR
jgi:ABC-type branched-subunit amino acid transport system ATPase component